MNPLPRFAVSFVLLVLLLGALPVYATSPSQSVSYNPAGATRYHAPLSQIGIVAVTHSFRFPPLSLLSSGTGVQSASAQQAPAGLTRFINDSSYSPQTETTIAVDPSNPSHVVGGYNDARYFFCGDLKTADCPSGYTNSISGFTVSTTAGTTLFKSDDLPGVSATEKNLTSGASHTGFLVSWGDPSVAAAPNGNFYYASLAIDPVTGANGIMIEMSNANLWNAADSCATTLSSSTSNSCWTAHLLFANLTYQCLSPGNCGTTSFEDKETVAVDLNAGSPNFGDVYVAWDHFFTSGASATYLAVCTQSLACTMLSGGSSPLVSGSDEFAAFSTPAVGTGGTVYVSWCNFGTASTFGPVTCSTRSSPSGGSAFGTSHVVLSFMGAGTTLPGDSAILGFATEQFRAASELTFAAGSSGALYFAVPVCVSGAYFQFQNLPGFASDNPGNCGSSAVVFSRSTDGGATWSSPAQVSQTAVVIQPSLAVDPTNGAVTLAYYSSQFDSFNHRLDVVAAVSKDGGQTFVYTRVTPVSDEPNADPAQFNYMAQFGGAFDVPQFGDYISATAFNGKVWVLFAGNYAQELGTYQTDPFLALVGEVPSTLILGSNSADAAPGDQVSFAAAGLTPGSPVSVTLDWSGIRISLANSTASQNGTVSGDFTVPNVQSQVYSVSAEDSQGLTATSRLGVGQVSLAPLLTAIGSLQSSVQSLQSSLSSLSTSIPAQLSSINSSLQASVNGAASSLGSSISKVDSSVSGQGSTLTLLEVLGLVTIVLVAVAIAVSFRGRGRPQSQPAPQPAASAAQA